ncbi:MAG TPA: hypothetical protein VF765_03770 [Polyangiaceae bacterium]
MSRTVPLLVAFALSACGSGPAAPSQPPSAPTAVASAPSEVADAGAAPGAAAASDHENRLVARMLRHVETARGLESKKPVPGVLLDRPALIARVKEHVVKELPPEAIRDEGLELALFGFIPTKFDYESAEYDLLQDQLAGYYEPADGTMYMASDLGDQEAEATLAHELVHALQDQRWNLGDRSKYRPGDGDRSESVSALAEGDATSAMFDVMIARAAPGSGKTAVDLPDDVFAEQIRAGMNEGPSAKAPHVMRTSLAAPYIYGTLFVHALRRQGGWLAVNRAWDDPPTTTEQVLHVDKWQAHEQPVKIAAPSFSTLGPGWKVSDEDSEGELGLRLALEEWTDPKTAAELSAGWGGDRGVLLTNGDRAAFAWRLEYDAGKSKDERTARAWSAIPKALAKALGAPKVSDAKFVCFERQDRGPFAVARRGPDLVLVLGPANTAGASWSSAGDCTLSRAWVREIAGAP